jgi:hypothetical protein
VATVLNQYPIFDVMPAYPLGPDGSIEEMLAFKLDPPDDTSWDFIVTFHATTTKEQKDAIILQILASKYIESVRDYGRF